MTHAAQNCAHITVIVVAMLLAGCKEASKTASRRAQPHRPQPVVALVAASVKDAVAEIAQRFRQETGIEVRISEGGSNALAAQILNGAPADVFLSASPEWAEQIRERGYAIEAQPLLSNELVLVVPKGNPGHIKTPADLTSSSATRIALAGENVPAGRYAEQALKSLGVYPSLTAANKVVRGQNVRVALSYVERGEVEAGVVYATDARMSKDVELVYRFNPKTHARIVYPLVLLNARRDNPAARTFYDYLNSPEAEDLFKKWGFVRVR